MNTARMEKTLRDRCIILKALKILHWRTSRLDLAVASGEHFTVLVPRVRSGTKEGTRTPFIRTHEIEAMRLNLRQSVAAPATVSGEP